MIFVFSLHTSSVRESPLKNSELRNEFTFRDKDTWLDRHFERTSWAPCWRSKMIIMCWNYCVVHFQFTVFDKGSKLTVLEDMVQITLEIQVENENHRN